MSIASRVETYVEGRPGIKDAILLGIANYSAIARLISSELGIAEDAAIIAALRRYSRKTTGSTHEKRIRNVLAESTITSRDRIAVAIVRKDAHPDTLLGFQKDISGVHSHQVEGTQTITFILDEQGLTTLRARFRKRIIKIESGLAEITIKSPPSMEEVSGVTAHLLSRLAARSINVIEVLSCWTDTIMVVREQDIGPAIGALKMSPE